MAAVAGLLLGGIALAQDAAQADAFPADTPVYYGGGPRGHIAGCPRLSAEAKAAGPNATLAEMKAKGGVLCSRCPGSALNQQRAATAGKAAVGGEAAQPQGTGVAYDPNTKVYCDALWMRVHAENCPELILKEKKKTLTLEAADKAGYRIGESGQSGRGTCCLLGYRRKYPERTFTDDTLLCGDDRKDRYKHVAGCHRYWPDRSHRRRPMKEWLADGFVVCPHCIERGPSLATITDEEWKKLGPPGDFVAPEGWVPKAYSPDMYPSKDELEILIRETLSSGHAIQELTFTDPVASTENFMTMRFFFPVGQWLALYQAYRGTGDKRILDALLESARHYRKLSVECPSAAQLKAGDPEGLAFMYSMAAWARITLQLARKHPGHVPASEVEEAEALLHTLVSVLNPTCEGSDALDPQMGIPRKLADDFRSRAFNRAANGIGTLATATAALEDLQKLKSTTGYQSTIDRYRRCVQEWVNHWKSVGCLYTEADGQKYFYYPYAATDKGKTADGLKLFGSEDQGHYTHCLQGVYLMYEAMPECGTDDDFMTAIANAVYHNSTTRNGSIQCPSADRKRPLSRKPFGAPRDRFYLLEAFRDGLIDGQCSKLSTAEKEATLSEYSHRLKTLHAQYVKALRRDRSLVHLGETRQGTR